MSLFAASGQPSPEVRESFTLKATYENTIIAVREAITNELPIRAAWETVVDHLSPTKKIGRKLRSLAVEQDADRIEAWIENALKEKALTTSVKGLLFVLFHPDRDGAISCDLSLTGCGSFDSEDHAWVFDGIESYEEPPCSEVLHVLCAIGFDAEDQDDVALEHVCLWYGMLAVAELCRRCGPILQPKRRKLGIGVGFGSGDIWAIGAVSSSKFVPREPKRSNKRSRLPQAEYFHLEGNGQSPFCECTPPIPQIGSFSQFGPLPIQSFTCQLDPMYPNKTGTYGSLDSYGEFMPASLAEVISHQYPHQLEIHPLTISGKPGNWGVFRALQWIDCLNREESVRQHRVVLNLHSIGSAGVFCVKGYYEGRAVFVIREVAQMMIDAGITGVSFIPIKVV